MLGYNYSSCHHWEGDRPLLYYVQHACEQMHHYLKNKFVEDERLVTYSQGGYDYQTSLRHTA